MSKVYSRFDLPEKKATEPGDRMRDTYKWAKDENGVTTLERDADIDRQAEIESYADECDIKNIVARASFDPAFAQSLAEAGTNGSYADITEYPETIHELKKMADQAGKTIEEIQKEMTKPKAEEPENTENRANEVNNNEPE